MRLAVLGLGFMGSTHLKALRSLKGVTLAAVCSNDERALTGDLSGIQGNLGGPGERFDFSAIKTYREVESALADPDIDAVDVCLPTNFHADVAIEALRRGKHVLVEKPMALDGYAADRMLDAAASSGRILMTAQVLRFFPAYVALRGAMTAGELGLVRSALFRRRCAAPAWGGGWLKNASLSGGGVFDLLIHDVDIALHLFGPPESLEATGYEDVSKGIDIIHAEFFYSHGGVVLITGGWHHPKAYPFSMEYTVVCDGGTVDYSSAGREPTLFGADGSEKKLHQPETDGYAAEIEYFLDCCRTGRQPEICPASESASAVKLARLMLEARNRNGERIECNLSNRWKSA
jgi:predicted dehydrogenase